MNKIKAKAVHARQNAIPFLIIVALLMGLYFLSLAVKPGWITWAISAAGLFIIAVTVLARLNDITPDQTSKEWQARRVGLVLAGASAIGLMFNEPLVVLLHGIDAAIFPTWRDVSFKWGITLMLLTTPQQPPWWKYITGEYKTVRQAKNAANAVDMNELGTRTEAQRTANAAVQELKDVVGALPDAQPDGMHRKPKDE